MPRHRVSVSVECDYDDVDVVFGMNPDSGRTVSDRPDFGGLAADAQLCI